MAGEIDQKIYLLISQMSSQKEQINTVINTITTNTTTWLVYNKHPGNEVNTTRLAI